MDIKIVVATHKKTKIPSDDVYIPLEVGRVLRKKAITPYLGDDTGESISEKNGSFCELTALYWAWKNLPCDYIGLCHYRRYFRKTGRQKGLLSTLKKADYKALLIKYDILVPQKRHYYIETVKSHYEHAHNKRDLVIVENIIRNKYPEYMQAFAQVMKQRSLYITNMAVMRFDLFSSYCEWLFSILFEAERKIDVSNYDLYQKRVFGFLAERLFNVWLTYQCNVHPNLRVIEVPTVFIGKRNWIKKIGKFLARKIGKFL